jgi:hypothetical protein
VDPAIAPFGVLPGQPKDQGLDVPEGSRPALQRMDRAIQPGRTISRCQRRIVFGVTSSRIGLRWAFGIAPSRARSAAGGGAGATPGEGLPRERDRPGGALGGRALAGRGVRDLAGILAVVVIVVVALCWVLADEDRSRRLAGILGAWRGTSPRAASQSAERPPGRQRRAAAAGSGPSALPGCSPARRVIQRVITRPT